MFKWMNLATVERVKRPKTIFPFTLVFSFLLHCFLLLLDFYNKVPEVQILSFNVKLIESEERVPVEIKQQIKKSVEKVKKELQQRKSYISEYPKKESYEKTQEKQSAEEDFLRHFEKTLVSRDAEKEFFRGNLSQKKSWEEEAHEEVSSGRKEKIGEKVKVPEGKTGMSLGKWQSGYQRRMTYLPPIEYPLYYRQQGIQAEVWLTVEVDPLGKVVEVEILRSSGYSKLDILAKNALRQARFTPLPGRTSNDVGEVEVKFQLQ